ncbi:hypothetical protein LTS10_005393 [Elasticomyces elasticus]|nr:hypothetical protein LTS10_005393 [Elasticomyces elasticus]
MAPRKRRAEPEEVEEGSPEPATQHNRRRTTQHQASDDDETGYGNDNGTGDNLDQMVKKLVRLALACEYSRQPIRRLAIREKVLGSAGRQFKPVFDQAQIALRGTFGMEMVELPAMEKVTVAQKRAAKSQTQLQNKTAQSYILASVLPAAFRDSEVIQPPAVPTQKEEAQYISLYTMLISLITLSTDHRLPDTKMDRYLRRLGLEDTTPVAAYPKTELLLKRMEKEGYIAKIREATGGGDEDVYWVVGPRGRLEVGDDGIRGLTKAVYGEMDGHAEADLERRLERSLAVEEVPNRREEQTQPKTQKKRGRKRKDEQEEEDGEVEMEEDD